MMAGLAATAWAARQTDTLAEQDARKAKFWREIGRASDKPAARRRPVIPRQLRGRDCYGQKAGPPEISLRRLNRALIGREVGRDSFIDSQIRARQLREQSEALVRRLEGIGIPGRVARSDMSIVGLVSGQAEQVADFRNCNMIPTQQSKNVHDMLRHVRYLTDTTKPGRLRMLVVSGGWCPYDECRRCHRAHTRRMSKFAAHPMLKELGISVEYYNVENTIHRDHGIAMLNLHSHALLSSTRYLGKKKWKMFLAFARRFFPKGYVHDSKIENPNEVVKYVFKPADFDKLTDRELGVLFQQIVGGSPKADPLTGEIETRFGAGGAEVDVREGPLKFYHPLGRMRRFRAALKTNGQKLILFPTSDENWTWCVTERRNRMTGAREPRTSPAGGPLNDENIVRAITRPMPKFAPRMEPCLIVEGYSGDFTELLRANRLQALAREAREMFAARVRQDQIGTEQAPTPPAAEAKAEAASMKHTTTTTVPGRMLEWLAKQPPPLGCH